MSRRPTNHFIPVSDQEMFHLRIFFKSIAPFTIMIIQRV